MFLASLTRLNMYKMSPQPFNLNCTYHSFKEFSTFHPISLDQEEKPNQKTVFQEVCLLLPNLLIEIPSDFFREEVEVEKKKYTMYNSNLSLLSLSFYFINIPFSITFIPSCPSFSCLLTRTLSHLRTTGLFPSTLQSMNNRGKKFTVKSTLLRIKLRETMTNKTWSDTLMTSSLASLNSLESNQ